MADFPIRLTNPSKSIGPFFCIGLGRTQLLEQRPFYRMLKFHLENFLWHFEIWRKWVWNRYLVILLPTTFFSPLSQNFIIHPILFIFSGIILLSHVFGRLSKNFGNFYFLHPFLVFLLFFYPQNLKALLIFRFCWNLAIIIYWVIKNQMKSYKFEF